MEERVDGNDFVQRPGGLEQLRDRGVLAWDVRVFIRKVDVCPCENRFGIDRIAQGGHIARDGAVAERNDDPGIPPDRVRQLEVLVVGDGALDERDVHIFREVLHVGNRGIDQLHLVG